MNEDDWLDFRADCIEITKNIQEKAFKKYLNEIGYKDIFAYEYDSINNEFIIYTCCPGIWIGKGGNGIKRLKEILSKDVRENCNVSFREIRGSFVACQ